MKQYLSTVVLVAYLLVAGRANALEPQRSLRQLHHTAWSTAQGLPAAVWAMAQSPDGYLLLGTAMGLYRFDGLRFEPVRPEHGDDFPAMNITALAVLASGDVVIGYQKGGVSFLHNGTLRNFAPGHGVPAEHVLAFAPAADGALWVTAQDGLVRYDGAAWHRVSAGDGFPDRCAWDIQVDGAGTLWADSADALYALRAGAGRFERIETHAPPSWKFARTPRGRSWAVDGALAMHALPQTVDASPAAARYSSSSRSLFDRDGLLWLTDRGGGIRRRRVDVAPREGPHRDTFGLEDGLSSNIATTLLEDREGNVWIGTNLGLDRFRAANVVLESAIPQTSPNGYRTARVGDSLYVAGAGALFRVRAGGAAERVADAPPPDALYAASDGSLYFAGSAGLTRWRDDVFSPVTLPPAIAGEGVWSIAEDREGALWITVIGRGLFRADGGAWTPVAVPAPLAGIVPLILQRDAGGGMWLYYRNGALLRIEGTKIESFAPHDGPDIGEIDVVAAYSGGVLFGGEFGIAAYDGRRFRTLRSTQAEPLTLVTGIVETPGGELWFNTQAAVVRTTAAAIDRALAKAGTPLDYELLDFRDGLPGAAEQDSFTNTAVAGPDARLWFVTSHGIAWVDPVNLYRNELPPPVSIRALSADGRTQAFPVDVDLSANLSNLQIDYTALSLSTPERVHFRYRLQGVDADWVDAGRRREAFYTQLAPGRYSFNVVAANGSGVWNEAGATLAFSIAPSFVQTKTFFTLCALAGAAALWLLYSLRLQQVATRMRDRLEERMAERERIARELHDTLLQGFQGLMLRFQSVADSIPDELPARHLMEQALERADGVLAEGRDSVRDLRAVDVYGDLPRQFAAAAQKLAIDPAVRFRVIVEGQPRDLHPLVREEVSRIGCEALFNAVRHARAANIEVALDYEKRRFVMRVRDDGVGIDAQILESGRQGHYGLTGMRERATKISADLTLSSRAGAGTEVELVVRAKVAYVAAGVRREAVSSRSPLGAME